MDSLTWQTVVTILGGMFTLAFAAIKIFKDMNSTSWKESDQLLAQKLMRLEHIQKNSTKSFDDFKSTYDVSKIESRIIAIETQHKNLVSRADDLRYGQEKLDSRIEKLTDLIIRFLDENN